MRSARTFATVLLFGGLAAGLPAFPHGEPCNDGSDCSANEWCQYPEGICWSDEPLGTCQIAYDACTTLYDPVCGCDFQGYSNDGCAAVARVSILHRGDCGPPPCGGYLGLSCGAGEYCEVTAGPCDVYFGACAAAPAECPDLCAPVCGCDGFDYASECSANLAGTGAKHSASCDSPTDRLVGGVGFDAAGNLFWSAEDGAWSYNAYRRIVVGLPPLADWSCWRWGIPGTSLQVLGNPLPGEAWWIQVTGRFQGGEGSMGMASDCTLREAPSSCP
jgi:hypothetical protein